mgnify:CR=1 FL=1
MKEDDELRARLTPERLAALVAAYNQARGWSPEGWLPAETAAHAELRFHTLHYALDPESDHA